MAAYGKELATAEVAYAAIDEVEPTFNHITFENYGQSNYLKLCDNFVSFLLGENINVHNIQT